MFKKLKRLTCRHAYMWSERRHMDVCYHCGHARAAPDLAPTAPTASAERDSEAPESWREGWI